MITLRFVLCHQIVIVISVNEVHRRLVQCVLLVSERRNLRKSTVEKAKETEERGKVLEAKTKLMKDFAKRKNLSDVRRLTQEELLAEAKITEKQNLRSLGESHHRRRSGLELYHKRLYQEECCFKIWQIFHFHIILIVSFEDTKIIGSLSGVCLPLGK